MTTQQACDPLEQVRYDIYWRIIEDELVQLLKRQPSIDEVDAQRIELEACSRCEWELDHCKCEGQQ